MADNKKLRGKRDSNLVAFEQEHERTAFCKRNRCTETEMMLAMWAAGSWRREVVTQTLRNARAVLRETRAEERRKKARILRRKAKR